MEKCFSKPQGFCTSATKEMHFHPLPSGLCGPSSLYLAHKRGTPHLTKDGKTVTEESMGGDGVRQAGKSFSFRSFPSVSWSERALRTH